MNIVLASSSPRRRELLKKLGLDFSVVPSTVQEEKIKAKSAEEFVCKAARVKAQDVGKKTDGLVIAADTVVCQGEKILGKPRDSEQALEMLEGLAGTTHQVLTGVAIFFPPSQKEVVDFESTLVQFRPAEKEELRGYVATKEPMDKAGAYAIQGLGAVFVSRIEGCYFNVVGLPLFRLYQMLTSFDVNIFSKEGRHGGKGRFGTDS